MKTFLGINNVIDAQPIINKVDGCADGFVITYSDTTKYTKNGKVFTRPIEKQKTVWVRDFNPNTECSKDGTLHGFGRPTIYKKTSANKPKTSKAEKFAAAKLGIDIDSIISKTLSKK